MQALIIYDVTKQNTAKKQEVILLWKRAFFKAGIRLLSCPSTSALEYLRKNRHYISFCINWDSDSFLAETIEMIGVATFNPSWVIRYCNDKLLLQQKLDYGNVSIPITTALPYYEGDNLAHHYKEVLAVIDKAKITFPFTVRDRFSTNLNVTYLVKSSNQLLKLFTKIGTRRLIAQQYLNDSSGCDYRVTVLGKKVIAVAKRFNSINKLSKEEQRKMIAKTTLTPSKEVYKLAVKAAQSINADLVTVTVQYSQTGIPVVFDVSCSLKSMTEISENVTIIKQVARYIRKNIYNREDDIDVRNDR